MEADFAEGAMNNAGDDHCEFTASSGADQSRRLIFFRSSKSRARPACCFATIYATRHEDL